MGKSLSSNQYYQCTTHIKFLRSEVIDEINTVIRSKDNCLIKEIYEHLRVHFKVDSFNRNNLVNLLLEEFKVSNSGKVSFKNTSNQNTPSIKNFTNFSKLRDSILNMSYYSSNNSDKNNIDELLTELKTKSNVESIEIDEDNLSIKKAFEQYVRNAAASNNSYNFAYFNKKEFELIYSKILEIRKQKAFLKDKIENMHNDYFELQIYRVLLPKENFIFEKPDGTKLNELNNQEIDDFIGIVMGNKFYTKFLENLDKSKISLIKEIFLSTFEESSYNDRMDVLIRRGKNHTLEEIGKDSNVSRERIRQVEFKAINSYIQGINSVNKQFLFQLLRIVVKNPLYITFDELNSLLGDYSFALIHILSSKQFNEVALKNVTVYRDIAALNLLGVDWYSEVKKSVEKLDDIIFKEVVDEFIQKLKRDLFLAHVNLPDEAFYKLISLYYLEYGNVYSKRNMSLLEQYYLVFKKYFVHGLHIYDPNSLKEFRDKYYELFEDEEIYNKENRAISSRISDVTVQVNRGVYNIEEFTPKLEENLAREIKKFIDNGPALIITLRIFNNFEDELNKYGIDNRYMLHAMLKREFKNNYYFKRDFISKKGSGYRVIDEIEKYLEKQKGMFNVDEINCLYPSSNAVTLLTYLSSNPEYIPAFNHKWINIKNIDITEIEKGMLRDILKKQIGIKNIITAKHIIDEAGLKMSVFFRRNKIIYPFFLFGILKCLFGDEFRFERPFISCVDTIITKGPNRIKEYIEDFDQITITELIEYARDNDLKIYSILEFIQSIRQDFIWADEDLLVSSKHIVINEDETSVIRYYLDKALTNREAINLKKINYLLFPNINLVWNKYLLASIISNYFKEYEVLNTSNMYLTNEFVVIKKNENSDRKSLIERYS